jgi:ABC-type nickel/cobalt efflux system permease component RcnA
MKLRFVYRASLASRAGQPIAFHYRDDNFPGRAGWKEIVADGGPGIVLLASSAPKTDRSHELSNYPTDLINSPPQDLEARVSYRVLPGAIADSSAAFSASPALIANAQGTPRNAFTELMGTRTLSLWFVMVAAIVAAGLGGLHALEPGHGKTIVAAYLVGSRGTAWHAFLLGLIVTLSHTAGVYLLGIATLSASQYVVPDRLYPWLSALSGLVIAGVGGYMLRLRLGTRAAHAHPHSHTHVGAEHVHNHGHSHLHDHEHAHPHDHDHPHSHEHGHSHDDAISMRQLTALGITGGIIPCPAALVVLLGAVSMHRIGFGLFLIVAFSIGLAAVLIAVGMLTVYALRFTASLKMDGPLIQRWLPVTSAAVITLFGVAIVARTLLAGWRI